MYGAVPLLPEKVMSGCEAFRQTVTVPLTPAAIEPPGNGFTVTVKLVADPWQPWAEGVMVYDTDPSAGPGATRVCVKELLVVVSFVAPDAFV